MKRVCLALLTCAPLTAQVNTAELYVKQAKAHLAADKPEPASIALQRAYWCLYRLDNTARRKYRDLDKDIRSTMSKADRYGMRLLGVQERYIKALTPLMDSYAKDQRILLAARLLAALDDISPDLLTPKQRPIRRSKQAGDAHFPLWLERTYQPFSDTPWETHEDRFVSPVLPKGEKITSHTVIGNRDIYGDYDVQLEIDLSKGLRAGLILGGRKNPQKDGEHTYVLELAAKDSSLAIHRYEPKTRGFELLVTKSAAGANPANARDLRVQVRDRKLELSFDSGKGQLRYELPRAVYGPLGFYVVNDEKRPGPVTFSKLYVKTLR